MAFSYASTNLADTKNRLRFLVQDTTDAGHFLEDEEIVFVAGEEPNLYTAAAVLCRVIIAKILKRASLKQKETGITYDAEKKAAEYLRLAESFSAIAEKNAGTNISSASIAANISPELTCQPAFTRSLHIGSQSASDSS